MTQSHEEPDEHELVPAKAEASESDASLPGDDEFAVQFEGFLDLVDAFGPRGAADRMRRFRAPEVDRLIERFEQHAGVYKRHSTTPHIVKPGRITWYTGPRPGDKCWPALEASLRANNWDDEGIEALDASSSRIVGLLEHPQTVRFKTKGLAIGHVQSGKTTNFTAVAAKAADRGYRLIIVLAGIHNELRRQTQERLTNDLVDPNAELWHSLTKPERDFDPPAAAQAFFGRYAQQPVLCVVKKNGHVLRRLIDWLKEAETQLRSVPAIVIDDEADQAAVATARINPLVRELLDALPRVAYVGYTATPFANLLIDPSADDLYPEDFIVDLPKPRHHYGTEVLFGRPPRGDEDPNEAPAGKPMIRQVPDDEVSEVRPLTNADVDGFSVRIVGELRRSVLWFWLATAARRKRGAVPHSTMLIHTSVRVAVHEAFRGPLESFRARSFEKVVEQDPEFLKELEAFWDFEQDTVRPEEFEEEPMQFDSILQVLADVIDESRIVLDNSRSEDSLDYGKGPQTVIAVGGNTFSRGLTLEGLVTSYFVRSTTAYDTLLQMGRWFGYRRGYADLPRIWMTDELKSWFRHIAGVEDELRLDVARYMQESYTPRTFAVRLRAHPALRLTAAAKMRDAARVAASFGGLRVQTHLFDTSNAGVLRANMEAGADLIEEMGGAAAADQDANQAAALWRDVPHDAVLRFIENYEFHPDGFDANAKLLSSYIESRNKKRKLELWNVAVVDGGTSEREFSIGETKSVPMVQRSRIHDTERPADIKTLMSRRDAALDLTGIDDIGKLDEKQIRTHRAAQLSDHGLMVLYPIDRDSQPARAGSNRLGLNAVEDVLGVGLVFPQPPPGEDEEVYYAADLSRLPTQRGDVEADDASVLDME